MVASKTLWTLIRSCEKFLATCADWHILADAMEEADRQEEADLIRSKIAAPSEEYAQAYKQQLWLVDGVAVSPLVLPENGVARITRRITAVTGDAALDTNVEIGEHEGDVVGCLQYECTGEFSEMAHAVTDAEIIIGGKRCRLGEWREDGSSCYTAVITKGE